MYFNDCTVGVNADKSTFTNKTNPAKMFDCSYGVVGKNSSRISIGGESGNISGSLLSIGTDIPVFSNFASSAEIMYGSIKSSNYGLIANNSSNIFSTGTKIEGRGISFSANDTAAVYASNGSHISYFEPGVSGFSGSTGPTASNTYRVRYNSTIVVESDAQKNLVSLGSSSNSGVAFVDTEKGSVISSGSVSFTIGIDTPIL